MWGGGGIGRRRGLKIPRFNPCGFESHPPYLIQQHFGALLQGAPLYYLKQKYPMTTFIFLALIAAIVLFICPLIVLASITGYIEIGALNINLSKLEEKWRMLIGLGGLILWMIVFIPLVNLASQAVDLNAPPQSTSPAEGAALAPVEDAPTTQPSPAVEASNTPPPPASPTPTTSPTDTATVPPDTSTPSGPSPTPIPVEKVLVAEGTFPMGSSYSETRSFYPVHDVFTDEFYIDKYEVTNAQYAQCVTAGVCSPPALSSSNTREHYFDNLDEYGNYPVIYVTWDDANTFCEWRGDRLPTEAEWEKAAKWHPASGITTFFPWGNSEPDASKVNFKSEDTLEVGTHPQGANSFIGVHDMAGNVLEWVADIFSQTYYQYSPERNPTGPAGSEGERVLRGGAWNSLYDADLWTFWRYHQETDIAADNVGFRCASDSQ